MDPTPLFITAVGLGLIIALVPGAVMAEALRRGIQGGFRPALAIEWGASAGDAVWAIIALVGLAVLIQDPLCRLALGVVGSLFLLYLAAECFRHVRGGQLGSDDGPPNVRGAFLTGAFISLASPFQVAFWLGIGASTIVTLVTEPQAVHYALFFVGYMAGSLGFGALFAALVAYGRRFVNDRLFRATNLLCGLFVGYLALSLLWATFVGP